VIGSFLSFFLVSKSGKTVPLSFSSFKENEINGGLKGEGFNI
jgi:hypothetical protein